MSFRSSFYQALTISISIEMVILLQLLLVSFFFFQNLFSEKGLTPTVPPRDSSPAQIPQDPTPPTLQHSTRSLCASTGPPIPKPPLTHRLGFVSRLVPCRGSYFCLDSERNISVLGLNDNVTQHRIDPEYVTPPIHPLSRRYRGNMGLSRRQLSSRYWLGGILVREPACLPLNHYGIATRIGPRPQPGVLVNSHFFTGG